MEKSTKENNTKTQKSKGQRSAKENIIHADESAASLEQVIESYPEVEPVLQKLDSDEKDLVERVLQTEMYSGPLPHPSHLKEYAQVHPEAPNIIFNMAKQQQDHKHYMELTHINKSFGLEKLGIVLGFILAFVFLVGGFILIAIDKEIIGIATVISGIIAVFVKNRSVPHKKEKKEVNNHQSKSESP